MASLKDFASAGRPGAPGGCARNYSMQANTPKTSGLRRWHRRVAWLALLAALCFALTGALHPLMTRFQPKPAQSAPPPAPALSQALPAPAAALAAAGIGELAALRLVDDGARWLWRARLPDGEVRYLDALSGQTLAADTERAQAERLARWYSGEMQAALLQAEPVTAFDADYAYVNRLLPVWRLRFDRPDGLVAYVSTEEDRLAGLSDDRKRGFQALFRALHTWAWLPAPARNGWINLLLAGVAATSLLGLSIALRQHGGRRWNLRRLHRWGGLTVALAALAWVLSGYLQASGNAEREQGQAPQRPLRVASALLRAPVQAPAVMVRGLQLVTVDGAPVWRWSLQPAASTTGRGLAMGEHQHHGTAPQGAEGPALALYVSAADGLALPGAGARHLAELAGYFGLADPAAPATAVLAFTPDYGFLYKRLPVWRLEQADAAHSAYYLDPASERLAARVDDDLRLVDSVFAYAHKWEWLTPWLGKDWRDGLTSAFTLLLIVVAIGGTLLRRRSAAKT
jgi:hypothetical protein